MLFILVVQLRNLRIFPPRVDDPEVKEAGDGPGYEDTVNEDTVDKDKVDEDTV